MISLVADILQIAIAIKLIHIIIKWVFFKKKNSRKSIAWKVYKLTSNRIHYFLNERLDKQKEAIRLKRDHKEGKVIHLKQIE